MAIPAAFVKMGALIGATAALGAFASYRFYHAGQWLPPMPDSEKTEGSKVRGCMSQVWLSHKLIPGPPRTLEFHGDSDAHIVKGLIALLFALCSNRTPQDILDTDIASAFTRLGLENHITMNRRNGFYAMVERIKSMAATAVKAA